MGNTAQTINISPSPQRLKVMIAFYEALNNVGKARFILTIEEKDREPFLEAYEKYYNMENTGNGNPNL